jgi:hypothetical protein
MFFGVKYDRLMLSELKSFYLVKLFLNAVTLVCRLF